MLINQWQPLEERTKAKPFFWSEICSQCRGYWQTAFSLSNMYVLATRLLVELRFSLCYVENILSIYFVDQVGLCCRLKNSIAVRLPEFRCSLSDRLKFNFLRDNKNLSCTHVWKLLLNNVDPSEQAPFLWIPVNENVGIHSQNKHSRRKRTEREKAKISEAFISFQHFHVSLKRHRCKIVLNSCRRLFVP